MKDATDLATSFVVMSDSFNADWPTWEVHPKGDEFVTPGEGTENREQPERG